MNTLALKNRQEISILLVFSMIMSCWLAVPMPAKAGFLGTLGSWTKTAVVTVGSLAAGYGGAVLGIACGLGPIGMVAGAVGGYIIGKKVLNWATSSVANAATIAGAVAGGLLLAGSGLPLLALGIAGGALLARTVAKLLTKVTGKALSVVNADKVNKEMDKKCADFISGMGSQKTAVAAPAAATTAATQASPAGSNSQDAYNRYLAAYRSYMEATQKGDAAAAKASFAEYQSALAAYQGSIK